MIIKNLLISQKKTNFYKWMKKIKLKGKVKLLSGDITKLKEKEIIYTYKENKFEVIAIQNQKVNIKFVFNENNILDEIKVK